MALIEYDSYKQKLRDLEPELEKLSAALDIESAKQEASRLEAETAEQNCSSGKAGQCLGRLDRSVRDGTGGR